ncbi:hypothetical protein LZ32DRAFT_423261 [Colletotrichum eremochloae]|nr:hypothetical protein LZ32DRAFT_423261 [Colletotrichum eremochloae]
MACCSPPASQWARSAPDGLKRGRPTVAILHISLFLSYLTHGLTIEYWQADADFDCIGVKGLELSTFRSISKMGRSPPQTPPISESHRWWSAPEYGRLPISRPPSANSIPSAQGSVVLHTSKRTPPQAEKSSGPKHLASRAQSLWSYKYVGSLGSKL